MEWQRNDAISFSLSLIAVNLPLGRVSSSVCTASFLSFYFNFISSSSCLLLPWMNRCEQTKFRFSFCFLWAATKEGRKKSNLNRLIRAMRRNSTKFRTFSFHSLWVGRSRSHGLYVALRSGNEKWQRRRRRRRRWKKNFSAKRAPNEYVRERARVHITIEIHHFHFFLELFGAIVPAFSDLRKSYHRRSETFNILYMNVVAVGYARTMLGHTQRRNCVCTEIKLSWSVKMGN